MAGGDREHPTPAALDRFLRGGLTPREAVPIVVHLLAGCAACKEQMAPLARVVFGRGTLPEPAAGSGTEYDFPLFRAFAAVRRLAAARVQERDEARHEQARPREVPPPAPLSPAARSARDRLRCETFLEQCRSLRHNDPEGAVLLARLAVTVAERLTAETAEEAGAIVDLQARALAELGNTRRVAGDLPGAETDLARALERAGLGTGDPLLLARIMDLSASVYTGQRRFDEAFRLLDWTHAIYLAQGDEHWAGRTLISKGISAGYALDADAAIRLIGEGLRLIDPRRDPGLVLVGVHSLINFLVDGSRFAEASKLIDLSRELYAAYGERFEQLKARWVEGRIAAALGDDARAEEAFLEVRAGFERGELPCEAALVALDLAAVWLRQDRTCEIRELIDQTVAIFRARKMRREAIGALLMLREACEKQQATVALLQAVAAELERLEPARRK